MVDLKNVSLLTFTNKLSFSCFIVSNETFLVLQIVPSSGVVISEKCCDTVPFVHPFPRNKVRAKVTRGHFPIHLQGQGEVRLRFDPLQVGQHQGGDIAVAVAQLDTRREEPGTAQ